ncbi:MAG: hypothetical protein GY796_33405, partial [Chloroflexi bacterium]|nr:hypothetical protein [Chloroflexota bacterium]
MNCPKIHTILFDWDHTLAYTLEKSTSHIERMVVLFQQQGINCTLEEVKAARHDYLNDLALGEVNGIVQPQTRQDIMRLYKQLLQRMGYARIGRDLTYRIYKSYGKLPTTMYDDVLPTLQALQKQP